jgi:hypothetical protein
MKTTHRLVAGAIVLACSAAASAEITLYGRENFRGRSIVVDEAAANLAGSRLNDRASSLSVRRGTWEACSEPYYRGNCVTLPPGEYPSLDAAGIGNAISSVREVDRPRVVVVPARSRGVVLFEGADFTGASIAVDGQAGSLDRFNDRARSMIVYDGQWELCEHDRFRGDCRLFGPGRYATLGRLSGDLSSLRPAEAVAYAPVPANTPPRVVLYEGQNFRGRATAIDEDLLANFRNLGIDDSASSLRVDGGSWVLCSGANFQGQCWTFGPGEYPVLPPALTDQVSSARRVPDGTRYDRAPDWTAPR